MFPARMHLRLSDQELATLVEMVSLAANIASWNQKENANDQVAAFETLESKILEKAGHAVAARAIVTDDVEKIRALVK